MQDKFQILKVVSNAPQGVAQCRPWPYNSADGQCTAACLFALYCSQSYGGCHDGCCGYSSDSGHKDTYAWYNGWACYNPTCW